jgi:hypothetical protein
MSAARGPFETKSHAPFLFLLLALGACSHKPSDAPDLARAVAARDAIAHDAPATTNIIKRYPDENPVDRKPLRVTVHAVTALAAFPKGEAVTTLARDAAVTQLAERDGFYLVEMADPSDAKRLLLGWVAHYAFEDADAPDEHKLLYCSGTSLAVRQVAARCAFVCNNDRECRDGATCEAARVLKKPNEPLKKGEPAPPPSEPELPYTTVCTPPPGAAPQARSTTPSLFGAPHDAAGKCPRYFISAPKLGSLCFRTCKIDHDCPQDSTCKTTPSCKLCFAN